MSRPQDRRAFLGAVLADLLDIIPPLPGLDTIGSIVDAIQIQNEREAYPNQRVSTAIPLLETIDSPIPFLPSPLELLPSHVIGVIAAERARRRGKGIEPQQPNGGAPQPPAPPPAPLPLRPSTLRFPPPLPGLPPLPPPPELPLPPGIGLLTTREGTAQQRTAVFPVPPLPPGPLLSLPPAAVLR